MNRAHLSADFGVNLSPRRVDTPRLHASRDFRSLVAAVRRRAAMLVVWTAVVIAAAVAYIVTSPAEYVAATLVLFEPQRAAPGATPGPDFSQNTLDAAQADSRLQIVKSERLLRFVFDTLDLAATPEFTPRKPTWGARLTRMFAVPLTPSADRARAEAFLSFMARVGARRVGQSYVIEISYRAFDPETATRTVNSITSAFLWDRVVSAQRGGETLQSRIASLKAQEEAALDGLRRGDIPAARFPDADARVIGAAIEPTAKSFPQTRLVLAFALILGLTTGLGAIITAHGFDQRIRMRRDLEANFDLPCLAVLPRLTARQRRIVRRGRALDPQCAYLDALRSLRPAVIRPAQDARHGSIGIVSWRRRDGRSTIASCLARIVAAVGEPVVLVDADLRHPDLTRMHSPFEFRGLTESLLARDPPSEVAIVRIDKDLCFVPALGAARDVDFDAYVGLPEMQHLIAGLQAGASVIVDLPAASLSADAQAVVGMLDGLILVIRAGQTRVDEVADCLAAMRSAGANISGMVLSDVSRG